MYGSKAKMNKTSTRSEVIDKLLNGGIENDIITTIFGPAGSGKTNICIMTAINISKNGKKAIYIDSENNFSVERLKQIESDDYKKVLDNIIFLRPVNFKEQKEDFKKLKNIIDNNIGIVIVDTISMLYRLEIGQSNNIYEVNRELGQQISSLSEITRKKNIPVLITNQVYQSFEEKEKVNIVGGDILKYGSKCLIELQKYRNSLRKAILRKHRSIKEEKEVVFKIVETGLEEHEETSDNSNAFNDENHEKRGPDTEDNNEFNNKVKAKKKTYRNNSII